MKRSAQKRETWVTGDRRDSDMGGYILRNELADIKHYFTRAEPNSKILRNIQFRVASITETEVRNAQVQPGRLGEYGQ